MESALDEDLERVSSDLHDVKVEMRTTDGRCDEIRANPSQTVNALMQKNYQLSAYRTKRSTVYLGDMALEHDDTLEECGICDGARLTVCLSTHRKASHIVIDDGCWQNRMGFAGEDEVTYTIPRFIPTVLVLNVCTFLLW